MKHEHVLMATIELLNERDRVTDAIVTHWFQNKRKMAKSQRGISPSSLIFNITKPFFDSLRFSINT